MSNHATRFGFPNCGRSRRCDRRTLAIVAVSLVVASGCGLGESPLLPQASVEIIRGRDSAGANIELEKRGETLTTARVTDLVLGTGEAEIVSAPNGHVEFAIDFPAGVTIIYRGSLQVGGVASPHAVGTWVQRAAWIFGEDSGTWEAAAFPANETAR